MDTPGIFDPDLLKFLAHSGTPRVASLETLHNRPRSAVWRMQFTAPWHGHEWVIAKQVVGDGKAERFNRELASLRLLSSRNITPPVAPRLLACDIPSRIFLFEDLGDRSLAAVLCAQDQAKAHAALIAYASTLGRMHAATVGCQQPDSCLDNPGNTRNIRRDSTNFRELCKATGVVVDPAFDPNAAQIETVLGTPGPFHALTHGDPCPDNERLTQTGIALIDFETSGFDHALLDAAYFGMAFPTCWCVGALPSEILIEMHAEYRRAFAIRVPEAEDGRVFYRHLLHASARWLLDGGTLVPRAERGDKNHLMRLLETDWQWGPATARQRLLHRLQAFVRLAESVNDLHGLAATAERLHHHLFCRWSGSERMLATYPAFRKLQGGIA